jgi:hypothetical protein
MFGDAISKTSAILTQQQTTLANEPRGQVTIYSSEPIELDADKHPDIGTSPVPIPPIFVTLHVLATITIDDSRLTFSVTNVQAPESFKLSLPQSTIDSAVASCEQRIQAEIDAIKSTQANLTTLQTHLGNLQKIIGSFQSFNPQPPAPAAVPTP